MFIVKLKYSNLREYKKNQNSQNMKKKAKKIKNKFIIKLTNF